VQRDLPQSLTVIATYLGSHGTNLMQQVLPNTYPVGAVNPCPTCPSGFVYLTSNGTSQRNAGQVQLRRRLRNGFTAQGQYTLAKATDNATAFNGASLAGFAIAQDWLDLDAERAPSSFDQRHQFTAQAQYTTGAGLTGGTLVDGVRGRLLKDWTFVGQLTVGSGLPLTPIYLVPVPGTGYTGSIRARLTGASTDAPEGAYLNPEAYAAPLAGEWGDAGRNSGRGPSQFSLNAAVGRTFRWGERFNIDWRIDAANVLNRQVYTAVNAIVGSPQFGRPSNINQPRKIQSSLRVRF
jgi:trimeric autotransporter adhesin